MKNKYQRNIFALTIHLMFSKRITGPIMMLFYQFFGLSYGQIGALSSITWFSDASLEIYGGAFSDVYGRKKASILYAILGIIAMLLYLVGGSFAYFAAASAVYGVALAIGSGNASALLFDTLTMLKLEKQFKKYSGRMKFPAKLLNGLIFLVLPLMYTYNVRLPFAFGLGFYLLSFISAFLIIEPKRCRRYRTLETIKSSFSAIWASKRIKQIIIADMIFSGFLVLCYEYFQPLIKLGGIPLVYFGAVYALNRLFEGSGSFLIYKLDHTNKKLLIYLGALLTLCLFGLYFFHSWILILFILSSGFIAGAKDVVISDLLNQSVDTKNRTTLISTNNLFTSLFLSIVLFAFGNISDIVGVQRMFLWAMITFVMLVLLYGIILNQILMDNIFRKRLL